MIEESLQTFLVADLAVGALVADRVFGILAPQNVATPFLVYTKVVEEDSITYCGPDILVRSLFQFDCYAKTFKEALQLSRGLRGALVNFSGVMAGTRVSSVLFDSELQETDPEPGLFRVSLTLFIWYGE